MAKKDLVFKVGKYEFELCEYVTKKAGFAINDVYPKYERGEVSEEALADVMVQNIVVRVTEVKTIIEEVDGKKEKKEQREDIEKHFWQDIFDNMRLEEFNEVVDKCSSRFNQPDIDPKAKKK